MSSLRAMLVLVLMVVVVAAGCSKKESDTSKTPPDKAKEETLQAAKPDSKPSMKSGIAFLARKQNEDGSFGKADVGFTGLAVYSVASGPFASEANAKEMVKKGADFLVSNLREDGSINQDPEMLAIYRTALAVMALSAAGKEEYADTIKKAQEFLVKAQFSEDNGDFTAKNWEYGGWGYSSKPETMGKVAPDLSNAQFALSALKDSGLSEDSEAYKRAIIFLNRCQNRSETNDMGSSGEDGGGFYAPKESKAGPDTLPDGRAVYKSYGSMTYALLKGFVFCGLKMDDPRVKAAYDWISQHYTVDENPGMGQMGLYYYHMTMAKTLSDLRIDSITTPDGRKHDWRAELAAKIISLQSADGSWSNKQDRWMEGDPTLTTSYALTTLGYCGRK